MTFTEAFGSPGTIAEGCNTYGYALSAVHYPTREAAARELSVFLGWEVAPARLCEDAARFQFAPEGMEGDSPGWWLGASGKGSKPVWALWLE
jgi:hypothetical protein